MINSLGSATNDMKRDNGGYLMAGSAKCENGGCRHNFADDGGESANHECDTGHTTVTVIHRNCHLIPPSSTPRLSESFLRLFPWSRSVLNRRGLCHVWRLLVVWCLCVICHTGCEARAYDVTSPEGKCIFVLSILIRGYLLEYVVGFTGFTALPRNVFKVRKFSEMVSL